jgi:inorganic pyrophosphatase
MVQLLNNAFFWQKLDTLYYSSSVVISQPKGSMHPVFTNLIYPVDYGYLNDTLAQDEKGIAIYHGTNGNHGVDKVIVAVDILRKDIEVKLLVACSEEEEELILRFVNQTDFQKTILINRGNDLPTWALSDN